MGNTNNYNHRLINKKHRNNKMEKTLEYYLEQNLQFKQFVDKLHVLTGTLQIKEKVDDDENPTMIRRLQPLQRKQPHQQKIDEWLIKNNVDTNSLVIKTAAEIAKREKKLILFRKQRQQIENYNIVDKDSLSDGSSSSLASSDSI